MNLRHNPLPALHTAPQQAAQLPAHTHTHTHTRLRRLRVATALLMSAATLCATSGLRINANDARFNLPNLPPGLYVATVTLNGMVSGMQKLSIH